MTPAGPVKPADVASEPGHALTGRPISHPDITVRSASPGFEGTEDECRPLIHRAPQGPVNVARPPTAGALAKNPPWTGRTAIAAIPPQ